MKTIDKDIFERVVLSATSSTAHVFEMLAPHLEVAERVLDETLFRGFDLTTVDGLEDIAVRLVCLKAYHEQIPHLDLVLTPTGFGIVSNENVAPASPERVKALRKQVKDAYDDALDEAIVAMLGTDWVKSAWGILYVNSLFFTAADLRDYAGMTDAHRSALLEQRIRITEAEEHIRRCISAEFFDLLLGQVRTKTLTDTNLFLVSELKLAVGAWLKDNRSLFRMKLANIINKIEGDVDSYPEYKNSEAYKVKHFERYQNAKDDSTYFFG